MACTSDSCNETTDSCVHNPNASLCNDGNACTDDSCDAVLGCQYANNTTACSDGNSCTTGDVCSAGTCVGGPPPSCDDGIACTTDGCSTSTGCTHVDGCPGGQTCNHTTGVCESGPVTATFQQDVSGYVGTQDTYLYQSGPTTVEGGLASFRWDTDDPGSSGLYEYGLIRFDNIFGGGAGQIPVGSTISSATLTLNVTDASATPVGTVREVLADWAEATATWNNFGGDAGVQADEYGAYVADAPIALGTANLDVASSLQAWVTNPSAALGWIFIPGSTNGLVVDSSEAATTANRPKLTVVYYPAAGCTGNAQCDDGLWCNGAETCNLSTSLCQGGAPPSCDDGVACTTDSCNETTDACAHVANDAACSDGNACTDDTCNPSLGCQHANNTASCSDGNACTTGDACSNGTCVGGAPPNCDDGVACTMDSCNASTGCLHVSSCPTGSTCNLVSGLCETSSVPALPINVGDTWKYLKGTAEPPSSWAATLFDDTSWLSGPSGFGYGTDCSAQHATVLSDMLSTYMSVYLRHQFRVDNPGTIATLTLTVDYDDAFVAYINGTEVARRNVVGTPPAYSQVATADHECSQCNSTCNAAEGIDLTSYKGLLTTGTNVLAIQAHNLTLASTDFTITPSMTSTASQNCTSDAQCDDANPCTDDTCNLGTGNCSNVVDNTNTCSDGVSCTADSCSNGTCVSADSCPGGQACNHSTQVCESTPVTVSFQQGSSGYTGTVDTFLVKGTPDVNNAATTPLIVDGGPDADIRQVLLRFGQIFESEGGTIPDGSEIVSASVTINVTNISADGAELHRMLVPWSGTATWNSLAAGVQNDGVEAVATYDAKTTYNTLGVWTFDVTQSLAAWSAGAANLGWAWLPPAGTSDSWQFDSSEGSTAANRPKLSVTYRAPSGVQARMACALGSGSAGPGGTVSLTTYLENLGHLQGVRGYQTQLTITRTSGSGTVGVTCPGGVSILDSRTDYLFFGSSNDYPATNCGLMRAASALDQGSVTLGTTTPAYLSSYVLGVGSDAALGSTFEISFAPYPGSALADENADPVAFEAGPVCVLTILGCGSNSQCDDDNPCTDDVCTAGVCQNTPNAASCDDGDACTTNDTCSGGVCAGGTPLSCDDGNVCTTDSCNPATGCVHTSNAGPCDDGNACTTSDTCSGGSCVGGPALVCGDGNACTDDTCNPASGCIYTNNTAPCDDGNACTTGDACAGGICVGGAPLDCNDLDPCTADSCSAGQCLHVPVCGVAGAVRYYRNSASDSEPSAKPTPNVGIDATQDLLADATTGPAGDYAVAGLHGNVTVRTLNKLGSPRASDHNGAVSSFDASAISRYAVGADPLSQNQRIAGDVSGNGAVTSFDAARVAQFAVEMIDHFEVATSTGSDWKFLRCDLYADAYNQNCAAASYSHTPLTGTATDNFYAVLYGDVTGNWQPVTAFSSSASTRTDSAEAAAFADDRRIASEVRSMAGLIPRRPDGMTAAVLTLKGVQALSAVGTTVELGLDLGNADGIEALDLRLLYDPSRIRIVDARTGELAARFHLATNDTGGDRRIGLYGILPIQGSGRLVTLTVEVLRPGRTSDALAIEASANEGRIPLHVRGAGRGRPDLGGRKEGQTD